MKGMTISLRGIAKGAEQGMPPMVARAPGALRMAADEIDRMMARIAELESGLNTIAQAGTLYGGGWCVAQARGHLESLDFDMWPETGKPPEGCVYPECECVFRNGERDCIAVERDLTDMEDAR